MTDINAAISAAASGMRAQQTRMRIAAENIANANSSGTNPNEDPFRRRIPLLETTTLASGARGVRVEGAVNDMSNFREEYNPAHPAADERGYVQLPNVDTLVEMMDMREAQRSYEANLNAQQQARAMLQKTLDLLR